MKKYLWILTASFFYLCGLSDSIAASDTYISGTWEVTTTQSGRSSVARLELTAENGHYKGRSGWLVPGWSMFHYSGSRRKGAVYLEVSYQNGPVIGELIVTNREGTLEGKGTLHGSPVVLEGRRPTQRQVSEPSIHDFSPETYWRTISGALPPALRIFPGDTVRTTTVDTMGLDKDGVVRSLPGNPVTGPFYIEGAMPGDTIAVYLNKLKLNRDYALQQRSYISPKVLQPGDWKPIADGNNKWTVDRERGIAKPKNPSDRLKAYSIEVEPMLGIVGVAPAMNQAASTIDLGHWGGNLDYREYKEGVTIYLPVYQAGALLVVGDGHAAQGDGEITGQGLEISMDVEFTVDLIRNESLRRPWAENGEYIMVSGIDGSLTSAMQGATSGLSEWLMHRYSLNSAEIATVLANSVRYDIAEVVDPHIHVVAKIRKSDLEKISKH